MNTRTQTSHTLEFVRTFPNYSVAEVEQLKKLHKQLEKLIQCLVNEFKPNQVIQQILKQAKELSDNKELLSGVQSSLIALAEEGDKKRRADTNNMVNLLLTMYITPALAKLPVVSQLKRLLDNLNLAGDRLAELDRQIIIGEYANDQDMVRRCEFLKGTPALVKDEIFPIINSLVVDLNPEKKLALAVNFDFCDCGSIGDLQSPTKLEAIIIQAIEEAAEKGHSLFIKLLLDNWDKPEFDSHRIYSRYFGYAFSAAVINKHFDIAKMLFGATQQDILRNNILVDESYLKSGRTPLMLVRESGNAELIALVEKQGLRANPLPTPVLFSPKAAKKTDACSLQIKLLP